MAPETTDSPQDFTRDDRVAPTPAAEEPSMFAAPIYAANGKKRRRGSATAGVSGRPAARTATSPSSAPRRAGGVSGKAIAAGAVAVVAVGALALWAARPASDGGVAELTPGQREALPTATDTAPVALAANATPPAVTPAATPPAAAPVPREARPVIRTRVASAAPRARPAAVAPDAATAAADASADLPSGPQPYASLSPTAPDPVLDAGKTAAPSAAAPAAAPPALSAPPVDAAPAAPEASPATP